MIAPRTLAQLVADDRIAGVQQAIVSTLKPLLAGVAIAAHPGKVDISELISKTVVTAPGIGIGWSRVRPVAMNDGSYCVDVEWVAYIVAEAKVIEGRRVEKEAVGLAIGGQLLRILIDVVTACWGLAGLYPPETQSPAPEVKPLFTIRDAAQGTAYYTVTWRQTVADIGTPEFPAFTGTAYPDDGGIGYPSAAELRALAPWIPAREVPEDDA